MDDARAAAGGCGDRAAAGVAGRLHVHPSARLHLSLAGGDRDEPVEQPGAAAAGAAQHAVRHPDRAVAGDRARHANRLSVRAEPGTRDQSFSLRGDAAGDADRGGGTADHHPGARHVLVAGAVCHGDRAVSGDLQHRRGVAQRRSRAARVLPHEQGEPVADPVAPARTQRAAVLPGGPADLVRPVAGGRGGGRVRGRDGRQERRSCLRDPAILVSARHPAHVRGTRADHAGGDRADDRDGGAEPAAAALAGRWMISAR